MRILDRYIVASILRAAAVVGVLVLGLSLVSTFLSQADDVGEGGFGAGDLVLYALLKMPDHLHMLLPAIALLGSLIALGRLAAGSELVVMRTYGISVLRLGGSVALAGLILALFSAVFGEWAAPVASHTAESFRHAARYGERMEPVEGGWWLRAAGDAVRIDGTLSGEVLVGVRIYRSGKNGQLKAILQAANARFDNGGWVLHDIDVTHFHQDKVSTEHISHMAWGIELRPAFLQLTVVDPNELSSLELHRYIAYLQENSVSAKKYRLVLWRNLVNPLTVLVLAVFALPFAFGALRSGAVSQRLFVGGFAGLVFFMGNEIAVSSGQVYGLPAWLAASWPTLLLAAATLYWLWHQR